MKNIALTLTAAAALAHAPHALAQASCSSDGAARPAVILERFISADCADCWSKPALPAANDGVRTVALDWIVPGAAGDDAPLSAAAIRDALLRLADLGRAPVPDTDVHVAAVTAPPLGSVRVASGPPVNDYLGAAIAWQPPKAGLQDSGPWQYHLLLVEAIAPGTEGTASARNLVRNRLQGTWEKANLQSKHKQSPWVEMRTMRIPEGAKPERLFMVGWVQNAQGQALAAAQSVCR